MQYINDVSINEAVIHVLDNNSNEVTFDEIGLTLNDEVYEYILKHIKKCLKDDDLKYGVFNSEKNLVKELSKKYFSGKSGLIPISKELASQLFIIMKSKGNIPSCDLLVVSISTEYGPMLAVLKMDYVKNYTHSIDVVNNKIGINIVPQFVGLPFNRQIIQKCVFIKPVNQDNEFDLMFIDKHSPKEDENYGSNYFLSNYISCSVINNERDLTKIFVKAAEKWTQKNLKDNAEVAEHVRNCVKRKLDEDEIINIDRFSEDIFINKELSQNFSKFIKEHGTDEKIEIDKRWVQNKLRKVRIKTIDNIEIILDSETYNDPSKFEIKRNGDGTISILVKNISNYVEK